MSAQTIHRLRPFSEVSPEIQKLVLKSAKIREAFIWKEVLEPRFIRDGVTKADLKATRLSMRKCFERAAVMIFDERAEGQNTWDTWLHYMRLAQVELGFRQQETSA